MGRAGSRIEVDNPSPTIEVDIVAAFSMLQAAWKARLAAAAAATREDGGCALTVKLSNSPHSALMLS
jgi:hypothetical protein